MSFAKRPRRVVVWWILAGASLLLFAVAPYLLDFEETQATVTAGDPLLAASTREPIDFRYAVHSREFARRQVRVPVSRSFWTNSPIFNFYIQRSFVIWTNRWYPNLWLWDRPPEFLVEMANSFVGLALLFILLVVRDAARGQKPAASGRTSPWDDPEPTEPGAKTA